MLAHQRGKLLKGKQGLVHAFDGNLLENVLMMPDHEDLLVRIDAQINILPNPIQMNIVASFSNTHGSILADLPNEVLPMDLLQPGVRVNERGKRTQAWKRRKCHTRRLVPAGNGLVGSLHIVMDQEGFRDLAYLLKRLRPMDLDTLLVVGAMVALDKGIFVGSMRRTDIGLNAQTEQESHQR